MGYDLIIQGGHVIDPALGTNGVTSVAVKDGVIAEVGDAIDATKTAKVIDATGKYVSPGWMDMHVHSYSTLSFSDPDTIGVLHGVPTVVDGGGGVLTYDDCRHYWEGHCNTDMYAFVHHIPAGIYTGARDSLDAKTGNKIEVQLDEWRELVDRNRDAIVGVKGGAHTYLGMAPINFVNTIAEAVGLPGYLHIGDIRRFSRGEIVTPQAIDMCRPGDMITHAYTGMWGNLLDPETGTVYPELKAAQRRGVLLDIGFGSTNFAYGAFDALMAQEIVTDIISSDLQGVNITGPAHSLSNVMSIFLNNGYTLKDVIQRVMSNPAKVVGLDWKIDSLTVGYQARITVFGLQDGDWTFRDCEGVKRQGGTMIASDWCVMDGEVIQSDMEVGLAQENWSLMPVLDELPPNAGALDGEKWKLAKALAGNAEEANWEDGRELHAQFKRSVADTGIDERHAANAVYDLLLESRLCVPGGWLLNGLDRDAVLNRLRLQTQ